jgi:hypothetical protein
MKKISNFETNSTSMDRGVVVQCAVVHNICPHTKGDRLCICSLQCEDSVLLAVLPGKSRSVASCGRSVVGRAGATETKAVTVRIAGVAVVRGVALVLEPVLVAVLWVAEVVLGVAGVLAGVAGALLWAVTRRVARPPVLPVCGVARVSSCFPWKVIVGKFRVVSFVRVHVIAWKEQVDRLERVQEEQEDCRPVPRGNWP